MTGSQVIDAHVHVWDLAAVPHAWIEEHSLTPRRLLDDLPLAGSGVASVVLVEAGPDAGRELVELEWLTTTHRGDPRVLAIVAALPEHPSRQHVADLAADPLVRAVRGLDLSGGLDEDVQRTLLLLAEYGLVLEVALSWRRFPDIAALAAAVPELTVVVDHCGYPDPEGLDEWRALAVALAEQDNVVMKLSGMPPAEWSARLAVDAVSRFSPSRCLIGSDWPITESTHSYGSWFSLLRTELREPEFTQISTQTPLHIYGSAGRKSQ